MKEIKSQDELTTLISSYRIYERLSHRAIYINNDIVCRAELNPTEMCLLGLLYTMSRADNSVNVAIQWLADTCHISLSTTKRTLKKLESSGYFKSYKSGLADEKIERKQYVIDESTSILFDLPFELSNLNLLSSVNLNLPNKKKIKNSILQNNNLSNACECESNTYIHKRNEIRRIVNQLDAESLKILQAELFNAKSIDEKIALAKVSWIESDD